MDPILVDIAQLRALEVPTLTLTPGRVLAARVIEAAGVRGQLAIAGMRVAAALPPGVRPGDELRLVVKEVSAERVVLTIQPDAVPAAPPHEVRESDPEGGGGGADPTGAPAHVLALRYETQNLGPLDLRFALHTHGAISVSVALHSESALAQARESTDALREAIDRTSVGEIAVTVTRARPPLDTYA